ncbi:UNVERIFIED_CONTAM: hypothetical protein K2H54_050034 [Gekko kuhli]
MSGEEEDLRSLDEPVIPVTTTLMTTTPVTMIPVTTVPVTTMMPVTTLHTMTLSLPVYHPLSLGLQGEEVGDQGQCQDASGVFEWPTFNTSTQESWLLTPAPARESRYKYKLPQETGAHPKCREDKMGWEEHLAHMESAQDWLIQLMDEALMGIPGMEQQVPILVPALGLPPREPAPAPRLPEILPKGLFNAKFDGTPEKLAFFMVQVEKFIQTWGHPFPTKAR